MPSGVWGKGTGKGTARQRKSVAHAGVSRVGNGAYHGHGRFQGTAAVWRTWRCGAPASGGAEMRDRRYTPSGRFAAATATATATATAMAVESRGIRRHGIGGLDRNRRRYRRADKRSRPSRVPARDAPPGPVGPVGPVGPDAAVVKRIWLLTSRLGRIQIGPRSTLGHGGASTPYLGCLILIGRAAG